jgi:hypothetical protein
MNKDYSKHKIVMRTIGIPLLVIGIILVILGFNSFMSGSFDQALSNMILIAAGGFLILIGFGLIGLSLIRPVTKYYAEEASPAITKGSRAFGKGIGQGLKESGIVGQDKSKEVIKVKCPHCGYLDSEDAEFCSKCGKKI